MPRRLPALAAALLLAVATAASAQIEQGRSIIGGSAGFFLQKFEGIDASWQLSISPSALYLFTDRFAAGARVSLLLADRGLGDGDVQFGYGLAPAARYYFTVDDRGGVFGSTAIGIAGNNLEDSGIDLDLNFGIGYSFFLNEGLAVEPAFNFGLRPGDRSVIQFSIAAGLQGFIDGLSLRGISREDGE